MYLKCQEKTCCNAKAREPLRQSLEEKLQDWSADRKVKTLTHSCRYY